MAFTRNQLLSDCRHVFGLALVGPTNLLSSVVSCISSKLKLCVDSFSRNSRQYCFAQRT